MELIPFQTYSAVVSSELFPLFRRRRGKSKSTIALTAVCLALILISKWGGGRGDVFRLYFVVLVLARKAGKRCASASKVMWRVMLNSRSGQVDVKDAPRSGTADRRRWIESSLRITNARQSQRVEMAKAGRATTKCIYLQFYSYIFKLILGWY